MQAYERLLKYAQFETASDAASDTCPSTPSQLELGKALVREMEGMGIQEARMDENGYVYGFIPENAPGLPAIGMIAHMDVSDAAPCGPMRPRIVENYDGGPLTLESGDVIDPAVFPDVALAKGKRLIVTDGRTLLGADDKAGVAEIMTACERILDHPEWKHGKICVAFTPDEEIGRGALRFDVKGFGADFAYTVDGGTLGEINYECFNAAAGRVCVRGRSVHPGTAKGRMKNASVIAMEFAALLPPAERPEHTEGYEGFFHLGEMHGTEEAAELKYIIRDHDRARFEARKAQFQRAADFLNERYGEGTVTVSIKDSYYNMREVVEKRMDIVERIEKAYRELNIEPRIQPIRGGTDGSMLSFMGLPTPNIATGGMNFHSRLECVAVEDMEAMTEVIIRMLIER